MLLITCTALLRGAMPRDRFILVYTCLTLLGCGGSSTPTPQPTPHVSSGLKIFLTSRKHVADFKNDPNLSGDSAIHKTDDFCNTDPSRPDAHVYKALLVDGVNRDAKALTDWVLKPSTTYYRPHDVNVNRDPYPSGFARDAGAGQTTAGVAMKDELLDPKGPFNGEGWGHSHELVWKRSAIVLSRPRPAEVAPPDRRWLRFAFSATGH